LPGRGYAYAHAKAAAESLARLAAADGLPVVIVNPCEVYGPHDTGLVTAVLLVDFARSSPVLVCTGGTSVVYVDDVADGIIAALHRGSRDQRYILGGDSLTIAQLARLTLELLGQSNKRVILLPNGFVLWLARVGSTFHVPLPFNPAVIPYATRYWFMDNSRARTELGVSFRSATETLELTLAWLAGAGDLARSAQSTVTPRQ
jgi:dihydroflavonol-4-reductase